MANSFQIIITAVDRATQTVRRINDTFERLTRPLVLIRRSVQQLGQELGLDKVAKAMGGVGRSALDVAGRVRSIVAPMAAVIGVGSIAGLLALATSWGTVGMEVSKAGALIGMSTSSLMSMRGAGKLAGVTVEELTGSLKSVGDTMEDALFGRNQSALMLLNKMRIGIHKTADGSIDAARGFKDIATYISGIKSAQVQGVIARQFGIEAALPLLRKGAKGIEEYQQKVAEFGGSRTAGAIAAAEQFGFKMVSLSMATEGVKISIGERLIPVLQPFIEKLITWVTANRELIATRVTEFVAAFATWIERINFNDVLNGMTSFISGVAGVIDSLGGWKTAALLVMGVMAGPFLLSLATFGSSLFRLGVTVIPVFIRALGLMRLAMLANPITAIILAIATAALYLYENWDKVKRWWKGLWGDMSDDAAKGQSDIAKSTEKLAKGTKGLGEKQTGGASGDWGDRPGGGASGDWEDAPGTRSRGPRGIRNNNPGNLRSWGDAPREDGFARFATPEAGLAAMIKNLQVQQSKHGLNTIAGIIGRWAPPSENDTATYVGNVSKQTGFGAHQPLDLTDKKTVAPLISSMIRQEGNSAGYSKDMVEKAVTQVVVDFKNAPCGNNGDSKYERGKYGACASKSLHAYPGGGMSIDGALGAIGSITTTIGSAANLVKRVSGDKGEAAAGAASWFSQLRPASFRGVPFGVLGGSGKFGRRQVVHEYPFRDTVWVEDLGRSARHVTVSGFLVGDDAIAKRDRLIAAIETAGDGDLMHPTYGQLRVSVMEFSTEERWDQGRVFMVNFNVIESGQRVFPSVATSTGSAVKTAAKAADAASATDFASKVGASLKQGAVTAAQAASTAAAWGRKAQSLANDATNLYNMVGTLTGSVGRYAKSPGIGKFAVLAGAVASAETTIPKLIALGASARTSVTGAIAKLTSTGSGLGT